MTTINEAMFDTLKGFGYDGALPDMYREYLLAETGSDLRAIQDLERELLASYGYSGAIQEMWFNYLRTAGYSNTLQEMLYAFWNDGQGFTPFWVPLTHTAVPTRAAAGTTATFTRATTSTWKNNDGYLVTGVAGEIGFVGARRVRNLLSATEDFSDAAWTANEVTFSSATAPDGTSTATLVKPSAVSTALHRVFQTPSATTGLLSVYAKAGGYNFLRLFSNSISAVFDLSNGTVFSGSGTITAVGDGWYRCSATGAASTSAVFLVYSDGAGSAFAGNTTSGVYLWHPQLEDVTAQTTQTAGEYVSVGVESAPYYHGSFVDGVKCFPTDISGNPIQLTTLLGYQAGGARTNLCLQSQTFDSWTGSGASVTANTTVAPDGTTTADTIVRVSGQGDARFVTPTLVSNAVHAVSLWIKKGTSPSSLIALYDVTAVTYRLFADVTWSGTTPVFAFTNGSLIRSTEWANGLWRIELLTEAVVAANTNRLYIYPGRAGSANGETVIAWGAQVELGSFASSYIPTTTIAVARNADVLTYSSAGNVDYGSAHSVLCTATYLGIDNAGLVWNAALGSDVNYSGFLRLTTGAANNASIYVSDSGGTQSSSVAGTDAARKGVMLKYAGTRNSSSGITHAANGVVGTTSSAAGAAGAVTVIQVGCHASASHLFGTINNVRIWQRALSSSELQAVTA